MIGLKKQAILFLGIALSIFFSQLAIAKEDTKALPEKQPTDTQTFSEPERVNAMIKELEAKRDVFANYIDSQTGPKAAVAAKLKAIIDAIQAQTDALVNRVTGTTPNKADAKQLNTITNQLETQSSALSGFLLPLPDAHSPPPLPPSLDPAQPAKDKKLPVFVLP